MREIDRRRIAAQLDMINRITRGGEVDYETALRERAALAERVENRRAAFVAWMKKQGFPQERIAWELAMFDRLLRELRRDPLKVEYPW